MKTTSVVVPVLVSAAVIAGYVAFSLPDKPVVTCHFAGEDAHAKPLLVTAGPWRAVMMPIIK